jgi:hypothetical protein
MKMFAFFLKYMFMEKIIGVGAAIFDKLEPEPHKKDLLRNTGTECLRDHTGTGNGTGNF